MENQLKIILSPSKEVSNIELDILSAVRLAKNLRLDNTYFVRDGIEVDLKGGRITGEEVYKEYLRKKKEKIDAALG